MLQQTPVNSIGPVAVISVITVLTTTQHEGRTGITAECLEIELSKPSVRLVLN